MAAEYLSERSVAEFFDVSRPTIKKWAESGVLPRPSVIGGLPRWHIDDLRRAAGQALNSASGGRSRSTDPDAIIAGARRHERTNEDRQANARRRDR